MRVLLQRVSRAEVRVSGRRVAGIGRGLLVFVGIAQGDGPGEADWLAAKVATLRLFPDQEGRMNRDLSEVGGRCLAVSQFTLHADADRGRRPSFAAAAAPPAAEPLFERFVAALAGRVGQVETGVFGAAMEVELVNDGPVTILLDRPAAAPSR
jgi:D-tyrosyl-tRNA(Tyr) deacylase